MAAAVDCLGDVSDVQRQLLLDQASAFLDRAVLGDGVDEVSLFEGSFLNERGL